MSVIDLLNAMIEFPSLSGEEDEICTFMQSYVDQPGVQSTRIENSLYFWIGDGDHRLLMASHLDVVPPSSSHPYPPFTATHVGGMIYGRGSVDAKASGAAMTSALLELAAEGWSPKQGQLIVALTECEETDYENNGLQKLLNQSLARPDAALVGEPTNLAPIVAQKGLLILRLDSMGKTAHAARDSLGENAILVAADDIQRLSKFKFERTHPILGEVSMNVTTIHGGTARNVIPDCCTMYLDIRSTPAYTHTEIVDAISDVVQSKVSIHSDRVVPVSTEIEENIVKACLNASPVNQLNGSPTASDWIYLQGIPAVKIGPGSSELSHTPNEHIDQIEVTESVKLYKEVVKWYFERSTQD
ncbi:MAG: M20/M25/M40 family metallo-hydrolase [Bacteroidetes bacterium]|nr:M20/M25/M40 family metallo-hydrolase [Bacteroidota bacterium]